MDFIGQFEENFVFKNVNLIYLCFFKFLISVMRCCFSVNRGLKYLLLVYSCSMFLMLLF